MSRLCSAHYDDLCIRLRLYYIYETVCKEYAKCCNDGTKIYHKEYKYKVWIDTGLLALVHIR